MHKIYGLQIHYNIKAVKLPHVSNLTVPSSESKSNSFL
jgi:hypothetical protein